jgi:hypothetical protein
VRYDKEWLNRVKSTENLILIGSDLVEQIPDERDRRHVRRHYDAAVAKFRGELSACGYTKVIEDDLLSLVALAQELAADAPFPESSDVLEDWHGIAATTA